MAQSVKLVVVGDSGVGKTTLLLVYALNIFPTEYIPTVFDSRALDVTVDNRAVILNVLDASSQGEDYERLRPLIYPQTDVVLLCFSIDDSESFKNTTDYWYPELKHFIPEVPTILVGTKSDLRTPEDTTLISRKEATALAGELGSEYCETSSLLKEGLDGCMETAIRTAMFSKQPKHKPNVLKNMLCCGGFQKK